MIQINNFLEVAEKSLVEDDLNIVREENDGEAQKEEIMSIPDKGDDSNQIPADADESWEIALMDSSHATGSRKNPFKYGPSLESSKSKESSEVTEGADDSIPDTFEHQHVDDWDINKTHKEFREPPILEEQPVVDLSDLTLEERLKIEEVMRRAQSDIYSHESVTITDDIQSGIESYTSLEGHETLMGQQEVEQGSQGTESADVITNYERDITLTGNLKQSIDETIIAEEIDHMVDDKLVSDKQSSYYPMENDKESDSEQKGIKMPSLSSTKSSDTEGADAVSDDLGSDVPEYLEENIITLTPDDEKTAKEHQHQISSEDNVSVEEYTKGASEQESISAQSFPAVEIEELTKQQTESYTTQMQISTTATNEPEIEQVSESELVIKDIDLEEMHTVGTELVITESQVEDASCSIVLSQERQQAMIKSSEESSGATEEADEESQDFDIEIPEFLDEDLQTQPMNIDDTETIQQHLPEISGLSPQEKAHIEEVMEKS